MNDANSCARPSYGTVVDREVSWHWHGRDLEAHERPSAALFAKKAKATLDQVSSLLAMAMASAWAQIGRAAPVSRPTRSTFRSPKQEAFCTAQAKDLPEDSQSKRKSNKLVLLPPECLTPTTADSPWCWGP